MVHSHMWDSKAWDLGAEDESSDLERWQPRILRNDSYSTLQDQRHPGMPVWASVGQ